jgi:hypothetical protein
MSGLLYEFSVTEDLEVNEAAADGETPEEEHRAQKAKPGGLAGLLIGIRHMGADQRAQINMLRQTWRPTSRRTAR